MPFPSRFSKTIWSLAVGSMWRKKLLQQKNSKEVIFHGHFFLNLPYSWRIIPVTVVSG